jgi:bifunctional DNA-binding transcriptional regulator/antitoxin component of YhaV-PrlF toxin-antitoxin module
MENRWIIKTREDENGDLVIDLPEDMLEQVGWKEGDTIDFKIQEDGSAIMEKVNKEETQLVLVECISQFRQSYLVEVPIGIDDYGNDKALWALDTVTMEEAKEFSQAHLGEVIVSHRVISEEDALELARTDNDYIRNSWDDATIKKNFFTPWENKDAKSSD